MIKIVKKYQNDDIIQKLKWKLKSLKNQIKNDFDYKKTKKSFKEELKSIKNNIKQL